MQACSAARGAHNPHSTAGTRVLPDPETVTLDLDGLVAGRGARHEDESEDGLGNDVEDAIDEHLPNPTSFSNQPRAAGPRHLHTTTTVASTP